MPDTLKAEVGAMAMAARAPSLDSAMKVEIAINALGDPIRKAEQLRRLTIAGNIRREADVKKLEALPPLQQLETRTVDDTVVTGLKDRIQVSLYEGIAATEAGTRQTGLQTRLEIFKKFDTNGYLGLTDVVPPGSPPGTITERQIFEQSLMPFIQRDPILNQWYQAIQPDPTLREEFFNNIFDAEFKQWFRHKLFETADATDTFHAKQQELEAAKQTRDAKKKELTTQNVTAEITRIDTEILQQFQVDPSTGSARAGSKLERLEQNRAIATAPDAEPKIQATNTAKALYDEAKAKRDEWIANPANAGKNPVTDYTDNADFLSKEGDYNTKKALSDVIVKAKEEIAALQAEEKTLRERKSELEGKQADLTGKETDVIRLEGELADLERKWIDQLQRTPTEAARQWFINEETRINALIDSKLTEMQTAGKTNAGEALANAMNQRYVTKRRGFLRREIIVMKKKNINGDTSRLLQDGPDALIKERLGSQINPETGANYTATEIEQLLKNETTAQALRDQTVKSLLMRKLKATGVTENLWFEIKQRDWAKTLSTTSVSELNAFKTEIENLKDAGLLNRERLWKVARATLGIGSVIALLAGADKIGLVAGAGGVLGSVVDHFASAVAQ